MDLPQEKKWQEWGICQNYFVFRSYNRLHIVQRTETCCWSSGPTFLAHSHIWDGATPSKSPDSASEYEYPIHVPFVIKHGLREIRGNPPFSSMNLPLVPPMRDLPCHDYWKVFRVILVFLTRGTRFLTYSN